MQVLRRRGSDGVELAYGLWTPRTEPRGVVVCIHGIRSHAGWYEKSCSHFADQGYLTYFPDRRGSGLNREVGSAKVTASLLVNDVASFLAWVRAEHPGLAVHLVGISWGGKLGVATLLADPGLADSLTLVAPGIAAKRDITLAEKLKVLISRVACPGRIMPIPLNEPELFTANPERIEYIRNDPLSLVECPAALLWTSFILDCRIRHAGPRISVPVFLMLAEHDAIVDNDALMHYYETMGSASKRVRVYAGAHHTLEFEPRPEPVFADMTEWFSLFDRSRS
jgi:alpha-beta hydrolase superfamily lysophospholipase